MNEATRERPRPPSTRPWHRTRLARATIVAALMLGAAWVLDERPGPDKTWFLVQLLPVAVVTKFLYVLPVIIGVTVPLGILVNGLILRGLWQLAWPYGPRSAPRPRDFDLERPQRFELGCLLLFSVLSAAIVIPGWVGAREKARTIACDDLWARVARADAGLGECSGTPLPAAERCLSQRFADASNPRNRAQPGVTFEDADSCQVLITSTADGRLLATQTIYSFDSRDRTFSIELTPAP